MRKAAILAILSASMLLVSCEAWVRDVRRPTPGFRPILLAELGPPPSAAAIETGAWSLLREQLPDFGWTIQRIDEPAKGSYRTSWITDFDRFAWAADVAASAPECGPQELRLWFVGDEVVAWHHLARFAHGAIQGDVLEPGDRQGLTYSEAGSPDDARKRVRR
jgi:hypothetical protein